MTAEAMAAKPPPGDAIRRVVMLIWKDRST
jgi:hypothetical protein